MTPYTLTVTSDDGALQAQAILDPQIILYAVFVGFVLLLFAWFLRIHACSISRVRGIRALAQYLAKELSKAGQKLGFTGRRWYVWGRAWLDKAAVESHTLEFLQAHIDEAHALTETDMIGYERTGYHSPKVLLGDRARWFLWRIGLTPLPCTPTIPAFAIGADP